MQVLIVEDDIRLAEALAHILKDNQCIVDTVYDGQTGLEYAQSGIYDAIVLDIMLPKMSGIDVVTELRRNKQYTPVLLLTARDAITDKVNGLDSGADDYMTKPFSPAELLARLRALTRRQGEVIFEKLEFGDIRLDLDSCELTCGTKSIHLGFKEFSILKILIDRISRILIIATVV